MSQRILAMFVEAKRLNETPFGDEEQPSAVAEMVRNYTHATQTGKNNRTCREPPSMTVHQFGQVLPAAVEKQFTLRLSGKTVSKGMGGPQFLRAILGTNDFRLCGAFSQDITFF